MPIHYNIEKDYLYNKGILKGIETGIEKGIEKERIEKNASFVKNLLLNTDFSFEKIAQLAAVELSFVENIAKQLGK